MAIHPEPTPDENHFTDLMRVRPWLSIENVIDGPK
jgi:hypothetical protein